MQTHILFLLLSCLLFVSAFAQEFSTEIVFTPSHDPGQFRSIGIAAVNHAQPMVCPIELASALVDVDP